MEPVAAEEIADLVDATATVQHPGMVRFEATERAIYRLNHESRLLHRVLVEFTRTAFDTLDDIYQAARDINIAQYVETDQSFAVRAQRHGDHEFGSPDVERVLGQAIVDDSRAGSGKRPPVDLDNPAITFRILVRHETVVIAVDTTGQRSLHKRWYRVNEHDAPLRPTVAAAMVQVAAYEGSKQLVDPLCGCGTIPIEAALSAQNRSPAAERDFAFSALRFLDPEGFPMVADPELQSIAVAGLDREAQWIDHARANATRAGVKDTVDFRVADATDALIEADTIVTDLPFGIRTDSRSLGELYRALFDNLSRADWDRLVALTTREDLVPYEPSRSVSVRRGQLEASILVID